MFSDTKSESQGIKSQDSNNPLVIHLLLKYQDMFTKG